MSKKKINNRLENLFSNLNNQNLSDISTTESDQIISWSWETDANGIYTLCSDEVTDAIGLNKSDFIGSPMLSSHISKADRQTFLSYLQNDEFPFEVNLHMEGQNNKVFLTRFHVFKIVSSTKPESIFRGFTQLLNENSSLEPNVEPLPDEASLPVITSEIKEPVKENNEAPEHLEPPIKTEEVDQPVEEEKSVAPQNSDTLLIDRETPIDSQVENSLDDLEKEIIQTSHSQRVVEPPSRKVRQIKPDFLKLSKTAPLGPLPTFPGTTFGETTPLISKEITGVSLENDNFKPAENIWTQQAMISYRENVVVSSAASSDNPAILASPLKLRNQNSGIIELVDSDPKRKWTEEDRLLMQEISNQLGLALENAQLYSTVQKELGERIKAEQLTERRNRDLSTLNQVGQRLSRLVSHEEIFDLVSSMIINTLDSKNLLITIYDEPTNSFSFPVCLVDEKKIQLPSRKCGEGYQESLLRSHAPLVLNIDPQQFLHNEDFDYPIKDPTSMVAVPLMAGDRGLGVITLFNTEKDRVFDHIQVELLSTVATQMATSLENASLFENISTALETIEVRERYQANVTKAVALLSEKGSQTLPQILEFLSAAAQCERTYFAKPTLEKDGGLVWSASPIYVKPEANVLLSSELLSRMVATDYPEWLNDLTGQGWHVATIGTAKNIENNYLQSQNISSILLLAIPSAESHISFIAFENFSEKHVWKKEEIDILRIASDALTNTLIREQLLNQVQDSLEETENLYSASHQLALSNTSQEMLSAIIQGVHSQIINRGILILFHYDDNGQIEKMVVDANYYSGAGTPPPPVQTEYLTLLYSQIFITRNPVFYDNIAESQIDKNLQDILIRQNIHSMAILPLWSANHQSGVLMLISVVKHHFQEQEIRSLPPLADQMATAIENLRLFESTQAALAETELLYKISNGISQATGLEDLIGLVGKNAMPEGANSIHLLLSESQQLDKLSSFSYVGSFTNPDQYEPAGYSISGDCFSSFDFSKGEPITVSRSKTTVLNKDLQEFFDKINCATATLIPMQSSGAFLGLLMCSSNQVVEFPKDEIHTLQIVTNSISVGIERQRLLSETQRRAIELQAAAELARDTTSTLSLDILLNRIVNLLQERFGFYHTAIYLVDETDSFLNLQEATGRAGIEMKQRQNKIAIGSKSAIGACSATGEPELINDTSHNPMYYPNPLLPNSKSELAIPLKISGRVTGVLDIHSDRTNAFTSAESTVFQILSDQVSIAIENAHAYEISQQAVSEMRELDRVKNQFLANMSHELRTPLNSVIGFSRVILKGIDGPINDVQKQDIGSIYSSGMHLLNMINEILDMSKIEAGKMELQLESVNISDVINSTVSAAMGLVKDKPIEMVQKVEANLPLVKMDQIRIGQVLTNLIANAVKFTEKGNITIGASLSKDPEGKSEILVTVTDSGIGIAQEDQSKLFQRFSQVDDSPTRKTGGTGLGLSICRSLVEMHKGRIGLLNSEVGKGSTFFFTLPLEEPKELPSLDQLAHEQNVILSIDDDAQVISLYDRYLQNSGYHVIAETNPEKAVERAIELQPMAITLDIMMPNKDGWQVMRDLKQNDATRDIPILICSIMEEEEKGISLGASDYLVKPFVQDDLIRSINRLSSGVELHNILIVDDDASDLRLTQKMLENGGNYKVNTASSGRDALEVLTNEAPDLIILDLFMPGLNGFDLLEIFRADPKLSQIPVIVLTGADLNKEQKNQLSEFGKHLFTKGSLKEKDLLVYIQESLNKIKSSQNHG
jgi:K+-sensing histidine kinase KdpD/CheY-like chemotaxis protein